jgi:RND family efflux transporter MFP subunit
VAPALKTVSKTDTKLIIPLAAPVKLEEKPAAPPASTPKSEVKTPPPAAPAAKPEEKPASQPAPAPKPESAAPLPAASSVKPETKPPTSTPPASKKETKAAPAPAAAIKHQTLADDTQAPKQEKESSALFFLALVIGLPVLVAITYFFGIKPRLAASGDLNREQTFSTERVVVYALAREATPKVELPLPGSVEAYQQASIFARTNGYVKRWLVDIGDVVKQGDLMAELDTPDVDAQLNQAKATSEQAKASLAIAQTTADRWNAMVTQHAVSQEEADEKNAARDEAKATLDADNANVARLTDEENFKEIRAPFTGKITYRNIEVGNLVSAGNGSVATGTTEMYRIAQTDPLRVYVNVPEAATPSIHPGVEAELHVDAYPNRVFHGQVVRNAGSLDPASRTLNTEIRVENPDGALLPGSFAEVRLQLVDSAPTVLIPANTLIVNAAGTQVALIDSDNGRDIVHLLPVKVGRDFGTEVEILSSVRPGDRLVTNPPADLGEGSVVTAKPPPAPAPSPAAPPAPTPQKS